MEGSRKGYWQVSPWICFRDIKVIFKLFHTKNLFHIFFFTDMFKFKRRTDFNHSLIIKTSNRFLANLPFRFVHNLEKVILLKCQFLTGYSSLFTNLISYELCSMVTHMGIKKLHLQNGKPSSEINIFFIHGTLVAGLCNTNALKILKLRIIKCPRGYS